MIRALAVGVYVAAAAGSAVAVLPSGTAFQLEVAADAESRARGYMYRDSVGPREGMLFVLEEDGRWPFWMKNCRVELDIVWLDSELRVVDIAHGQVPCPDDGECPWIRPMRPARFVIEFAGGTAEAERLRLGDRIAILMESAPR